MQNKTEIRVNIPLPPETHAALGRVAAAHGRAKSREAAQIIIRAMRDAEHPAEHPATEGVR